MTTKPRERDELEQKIKQYLDHMRLLGKTPSAIYLTRKQKKLLGVEKKYQNVAVVMLDE